MICRKDRWSDIRLNLGSKILIEGPMTKINNRFDDQDGGLLRASRLANNADRIYYHEALVHRLMPPISYECTVQTKVAPSDFRLAHTITCPPATPVL